MRCKDASTSATLQRWPSIRTYQTRLTNKWFKWALTGLGLELANTNNDVLRLLGFAAQVVLNDALGAACVTSLSIESGTRVMWHHAVTTTKYVLSRAPDVVFGCGLDVPNITGVT